MKGLFMPGHVFPIVFSFFKLHLILYALCTFICFHSQMLQNSTSGQGYFEIFKHLYWVEMIEFLLFLNSSVTPFQ